MTTYQLLDLFRQNLSIEQTLKDNLNGNNYLLLFGKYKILNLLGKGSFATVYKAINTENDRPVALKIVELEKVWTRYQQKSIRDKVKASLASEEHHMRKCHSAHIIKIFQSFENNISKVYVLEYCNEGTLQNYLKKRGRIQEDDAIVILKQIMFGLAELHRNEIIHRDMKPANILIHNGIFKISDLGLSKEVEFQDAVEKHTCLGTRCTMAPEVYNEQPYGLKADIWAIGVIFFWMIEYDTDLNIVQNLKRIERFIKREDKFKSRIVLDNSISIQARDFLKRTLEIDQNKRLNWEETLTHPIFAKKQYCLPQFFLPYVEEDFQQLNKMKKAEGQEEDINPEQSFNFQTLCEEYLQCRKAQFILTKIVVPLQQKHLLDLSNHYHIQLMYLLIVRCKTNISFSQQQIKKNYPQKILDTFNKNISILYERIKLKFQNYAELLKIYQNKVITIIKEKIIKIASKNSWNEREKFINGVQGLDFNRVEQINFTYEKYIVNIINELKGNPVDEESLKTLLKAYRCIAMVKKDNLQGNSLHTYVLKMINSEVIS